MAELRDVQKELRDLKAKTEKEESKNKGRRETEFINMRQIKDNAINFDVLTDEELAWVMMGLGVTQEDVSYIDKDKDKIMKALGNWKKQIVSKDKSREGHVDMLKVAMYNSYIGRV